MTTTAPTTVANKTAVKTAKRPAATVDSTPFTDNVTTVARPAKKVAVSSSGDETVGSEAPNLPATVVASKSSKSSRSAKVPKSPKAPVVGAEEATPTVDTPMPPVSSAPSAPVEQEEPVTEKKPTTKRAKKPKTPRVDAVVVDEATVDTTVVTDLAENEKEKTGKTAKKVRRGFAVAQLIHEADARDVNEFKKIVSSTPAGAARKAANQACKKFPDLVDRDLVEIEITMQEIVKGADGKKDKIYMYRAIRRKADKVVPFKTNDATKNNGEISIPFKYTIELKSIRKKKEVVAADTKAVVATEVVTEVNDSIG